ncbi:MAG TPA: cytochrome b5 domain-containing protein, partial [Spirochaetia bacterium]|nr:cytochrome b5 domain-containing protein [Spirochaetia bacterium]
MEQQRRFSLEELRTFNGQDGRPIYIAYNGRVFDVSASKMWRGGLHMKRHAAGQDLSSEIKDAPHGEDVL